MIQAIPCLGIETWDSQFVVRAEVGHPLLTGEAAAAAAEEEEEVVVVVVETGGDDDDGDGAAEGEEEVVEEVVVGRPAKVGQPGEVHHPEKLALQRP